MAVSQNGYAANDISRTQSWKIPGTVRAVRLRKGSPGALLVHLAAWFDKNVEDIEAGQLDDWGYAERPIRGGVQLSNHASGTAMDLNAVKHPLGKRGTFTKAQTEKIRTHLKTYNGCIRWGGDYQNRPDEMHFEIDKSPEACDAAWGRLNAKPTTPAGGSTMAELTETQVYNQALAANRQYGRDFWTAPTGTGTAALALLREIKIQLDRIEDDTDSLQASQALVAKLDANMETLKAADGA